jgi:hypothetical protein
MFGRVDGHQFGLVAAVREIFVTFEDGDGILAKRSLARVLQRKTRAHRQRIEMDRDSQE